MARQRSTKKELANRELSSELMHERGRARPDEKGLDDRLFEGFSLQEYAEPVEPQFEPTHFAPVSYS